MLGENLVALAGEFEKLEKAGKLSRNAEELKRMSDGGCIDNDLVELPAFKQVGNGEQRANFGQARKCGLKEELNFIPGKKRPLLHQFSNRLAVLVQELLKAGSGINLPDRQPAAARMAQRLHSRFEFQGEDVAHRVRRVGRNQYDVSASFAGEVKCIGSADGGLTNSAFAQEEGQLRMLMGDLYRHQLAVQKANMKVTKPQTRAQTRKPNMPATA